LLGIAGSRRAGDSSDVHVKTDTGEIDYQGAPIYGTAWLSGNCDYRGLRGGYWGSRPSFLRSDARKTLWADYPRDNNGLRVARDLDH